MILPAFPVDLPGPPGGTRLAWRGPLRIPISHPRRSRRPHRTFIAVPYAYLILKLAGAAYPLLAGLECTQARCGSPFDVVTLPRDSPKRLFAMGFLTNVLNPKAAVLYLSILPQFIQPAREAVFNQCVELGFVQMLISLLGNLTVVLISGGIAHWLACRPAWAQAQRYLMGTVLAGLGLRLVFDRSK